MSRQHLEPSAAHPITITPAEQRVTVAAGGSTIAVSDHALVLQEASYPPVYYVPESDVDASLLAPSETSTYCPFKGDASYVDLALDGGTTRDVAWTYREPFPAVAEIAGHLAFYADKVELKIG